MNGVQLSRLPPSAKVFCTLFLVGIGCGSLAAFAQAATSVGLSPSAVQASLAPEMPMTGMGHAQMHAEKEIDLHQIPGSTTAWIQTPLLIQTSHTHLFGQTLIAGLLGLIFLFASVPERLKAAIVAVPFAATLIDVGGMWLTRFASPRFGVLVIAGGTLFALGYLLIAAVSLYDLWLRKESVS
jgi:hypothetical protein